MILLCPFTCVKSSGSECSTITYITFNIGIAFTTYYVIGCLELYPTLVKSWQDQLVLKNYLKVVDAVCRPLLVGSKRLDDKSIFQSKCLDDLQNIPSEHLKTV